MNGRLIKRGLWCWLASAGLLAATVLPEGRNQLPAAPGAPQEGNFQARQFYYTSWGPTSIVRPDPATGAPVGGTWQRPDPWRWEDASLYYFTKPVAETPIGHSKVGRKLLELYEAQLNLLPLEPRLGVYASFTGAGYGLDAWQRTEEAGLEAAEVNPLPEPPPLALLVTGLVFLALARGLRRRRAG